MIRQPTQDRLVDADLCDAVTLAARRMLLDAGTSQQKDYLRKVLPDESDVTAAKEFLSREADRLTRWA